MDDKSAGIEEYASYLSKFLAVWGVGGFPKGGTTVRRPLGVAATAAIKLKKSTRRESM
jgi:hypothetical protein